MKGLIVFLAVCSLAAAMVPRERPAVDDDDRSTSKTLLQSQKPDCASTTPCGWTIYGDVEQEISNSYCQCRDDTVCRDTDKFDSTGKIYEKLCQLVDS